jgi:hypothetical protein
MRIYIDTECKCHTTNPGGAFREFDVPLFDGKCKTFVEGYLYVPFDEIWTHEDGTVFRGEMISPWKDYFELDVAQRIYELALIADMQNALNKLGVTLDE